MKRIMALENIVMALWMHILVSEDDQIYFVEST